jgi:2-polyprenyl-3-methyl-5-hydroxy-6-metoxy-1,4-benzoquinol methylase
MVERAYLDYYGENDIIPVRQDTRDIALHFARRRSLYRHLGLHSSAFRNSRVLEFGPGTGDNALFIASCAPETFVLVDDNPASIRAVEHKISCGLLPRDRVECCKSEVRAYASGAPFDVVLCEGVLGGQQNPEDFLRHVASFVAPDGLLVITTMSSTSLLAEACRRVLKPVIATRFAPKNPLEELTGFFGPDLRSLPGMSRLHEDWVHDNILCPWPERYEFTIPESISTLDAEFDVLGTSPHFIQDWRYEATWNEVALEEYDRWSSHFLDYRVVPDTPGKPRASALETECRSALRLHHKIWHGSLDLIPQFVAALESVREMIQATLPETGTSITDFLTGLDGLLAGNRHADFGAFRPWFGRGQQYISFVRKTSA